MFYTGMISIFFTVPETLRRVVSTNIIFDRPIIQILFKSQWTHTFFTATFWEYRILKFLAQRTDGALKFLLIIPKIRRSPWILLGWPSSMIVIYSSTIGRCSQRSPLNLQLIGKFEILGTIFCCLNFPIYDFWFSRATRIQFSRPRAWCAFLELT